MRSSRPGWTGIAWRVALALCWAALIAAPSAAEEPQTSGQELLSREPPELVNRLFEKKMLLLEEVKKDDGGTLFVAYVLFDQPRDRVVGLISESSRQREYRPELRKVKLIEESGQTRIDEHQIKIMFTKITYRLSYLQDLGQEPQRLSWKLDPSFDNDIKRLEGFWELFELDEERTVGRFGSIVDVGAVPKLVQNVLSRKTVLNTVENTRYWVIPTVSGAPESHPWRSEGQKRGGCRPKSVALAKRRIVSTYFSLSGMAMPLPSRAVASSVQSKRICRPR